MKLIQRLGTSVAAAAIAASMIAAPAAAAAPSSCPAGYGCIWEDTDYKTDGLSSRVIKFEYKIYEMDTFTYYWILGSPVRGGDNGSSLYSNGNIYATRWYTGEYFSGQSIMVLKGSGMSSLSGTIWNNSIDSACFTSSCN